MVDGSAELYDRLANRWHDEEVKVHLNDETIGAAASRNKAAEMAHGSVVAFMDDDAIADEAWLTELIRCYTDLGAVAAGGRMTPIWLAGQPTFVPEEFYWLFGVTYRGFPEEMTEVRNTFASNLSFDTVTFERLGGFNPNVGPTGESQLQSAETELCVRLTEETGQGVLYNPDAVVGHKIYEYRTKPAFLLRRAFWQGVSKRGMQAFGDSELGAESAFLGLILTRSIPERLRMVVVGPRRQGLLQLLFLVMVTGAVGLGYVWGVMKFAGKRD